MKQGRNNGVPRLRAHLLFQHTIMEIMSDSDQSTSRRSPCSHHSGDSDSGATESQPKSRSGRKEAACWVVEEEAALLRYLCDNQTGTDGVNFPKKTYMGASVHLAGEFTIQKGRLKTDGACRSKFSSLKQGYIMAQDLKVGRSSSGFTWTDKGGATIDKHTASAWAGYVKASTTLPITALDPNLFFFFKSHPNAKQFREK